MLKRVLVGGAIIAVGLFMWEALGGSALASRTRAAFKGK